MARKPIGRGCFRLYLYMALVSAAAGFWFFGSALAQTKMDPRNVALWLGLLYLLMCLALFVCAIATILGKRWGILGLFATAGIYLLASVLEISLLPSGSMEKLISAALLLLLLCVLGLPELKAAQPGA